MDHAQGMSLHGALGGRKYLNASERKRFIAAAGGQPRDVWLFCLLLAWTGARISEGLAVTPAAFDLDRSVVAIITLKRRRKVIREIVLPPAILAMINAAYGLEAAQLDPNRVTRRLWPWCRVTGWRHVKAVMASAGIGGDCAMPKGLRHGFAVAAFQASVPPHLVQRWLGHASLKTTAIYAEVSGAEEFGFAERMWEPIGPGGASKSSIMSTDAEGGDSPALPQ